ncbi:axonemal dynein light intermediate polypeptide 1 [Pongo pygmaeus]|uniref:Axonemal dynein light intermediate polypeptide 1 n=1 Tax=Pongo abelii TaxID=9601 RepID=H2N7Y3_PONAB|nr:axonemal dynein light intermediate polypeptide 1 [Pongo abelii]XP_054351043.1 axonemal dynein light intermediate polypeptide 1 [Pongo pygmaeus]PNJ89913.1 DNALI1 isoform 1 [Pongo abelii]
MVTANKAHTGQGSCWAATLAAAMIPPADSLLKYDTPVLVSRNTEKRSPKARLLKVSPQQPGPSGSAPQLPKTKLPSTPCVPDPTKQAEEILNAILPPREWVEDKQLWIQQVSSTPSTRMDVVHLQEQLDLKLQQRQARETGICPVRRELYSQCFDELIREVTINCAERGLLLLRVRDEIRMTIAAYQTLYESSVAFGMRKALQAEQGKSDMERKIAELETEKRDLERQVNEQKAKCEATEKRESERRQVEEKKHNEEIQFLKRTNQQLKAQLEGIIAPKK